MTKLKQYKMFIDGEWVESDTKKTFETLKLYKNCLGNLFFGHVLESRIPPCFRKT